MSFLFVDHSKIDEDDRKIIRSHVMKGKNVGKVRLRKEVINHRNHAIASLAPSDVVYKGSHTKGCSLSTGDVGDPLDYFEFPCRILPYMRQSLHRWMSITHQCGYPIDFCIPVDAMRSIWFYYLQTNEAVFHCVLAMSESIINDQLGNHNVSPQALRHWSNTYRCINQALRSRDALSDGTVAAVVSLAIYEDLKREPGSTSVHLDALERIVNLRGGLGGLDSNLPLVQKICRADIEHAMHNNIRPRFYRDNFPHAAMRTAIAEHLTENADQSVDCILIRDSRLRQIHLDFTTACHVLNSGTWQTMMEPYAFQETFISLSYRLLDISPLGEDDDVTNQDMVYSLAMLALMKTIVLFQVGHPRRPGYDVLAHKLRKALGSERKGTATKMDKQLELWLAFVGGMSVFDSKDSPWLVPQIKTCLHELDIDSWQGLHEKIAGYPWIDAIHDKPGHELWKTIVWT